MPYVACVLVEMFLVENEPREALGRRDGEAQASATRPIERDADCPELP